MKSMCFEVIEKKELLTHVCNVFFALLVCSKTQCAVLFWGADGAGLGVFGFRTKKTGAMFPCFALYSSTISSALSVIVSLLHTV